MSASGQALARRPEDLDRRWAAHALAHRAPGATVHGVKTLALDVGTTTRVRLAVEHDAPAPRRWFVKLPSLAWRARAITAAPRLPQTEVRFYAEVADELQVPRPAAIAALSRVGRGFTVVLGDLDEVGARPGRAGEALSPEHAAAVVDMLAALHAERWADPRLDGELAWLGGRVRRLEDLLGTALAVPLMRRGLDRAGDAVPAHLRAPALGWSRRRRTVMRALGAGPRTLVHHDCHPGNLYWHDGQPGLLDWQMVRIGDGVGDVAYLLATALEPQARRETEWALLTRYSTALGACGVSAAGTDIEERYRRHLARALEAMIATLAIGGLMDDGAARTMARRAAIAVDELGALEAR